jgi:hypothetical protein
MVAALSAWCDRRAFEPLRMVLPHYPMFNGTTDELVDLARALKTVRAKLGAVLPSEEFDRLVSLLHAAEDALAKGNHNV